MEDLGLPACKKNIEWSKYYTSENFNDNHHTYIIIYHYSNNKDLTKMDIKFCVYDMRKQTNCFFLRMCNDSRTKDKTV